VVDDIARTWIVEAIANGSSFLGACTSAGIDRAIVKRWIREGERIEAERDKADEAGEDYEVEVHLLPYVEFVEGLRLAKERGTVEILKGIRKHLESDWRAGAWILTHSRDGEFADQAKLAHAGPDGGPLQVEHMTDAEVIASVLERVDQYAVDHGIAGEIDPA
jgi:hypothetical protein